MSRGASGHAAYRDRVAIGWPPTTGRARTTGAGEVMSQSLTLAIRAPGQVATGEASGWKFTGQSRRLETCGLTGRPARPLPKGDCARSESNATCPHLSSTKARTNTLRAHAH